MTSRRRVRSVCRVGTLAVPTSRRARQIVLAFTAGIVVGGALLNRRLFSTWGTEAGEAETPLPGDNLVSEPQVVATRAVTIAAPPREVWPWLVQMGYGRGGFYSFDALERAIGLDITSANRVEERWQQLDAGDEVPVAPGLELKVAQLERFSHLVLLGRDVAPAGEATPTFDFTWAFVLRPTGGGCRLLVRERYAAKSLPARALVEAVQGAAFLMSARMLQGIRTRAERG